MMKKVDKLLKTANIFEKLALCETKAEMRRVLAQEDAGVPAGAPEDSGEGDSGYPAAPPVAPLAVPPVAPSTTPSAATAPEKPRVPSTPENIQNAKNLIAGAEKFVTSLEANPDRVQKEKRTIDFYKRTIESSVPYDMWMKNYGNVQSIKNRIETLLAGGNTNTTDLLTSGRTLLTAVHKAIQDQNNWQAYTLFPRYNAKRQELTNMINSMQEAGNTGSVFNQIKTLLDRYNSYYDNLLKYKNQATAK